MEVGVPDVSGRPGGIGGYWADATHEAELSYKLPRKTYHTIEVGLEEVQKFRPRTRFSELA
jgi:hypothetical protein